LQKEISPSAGVQALNVPLGVSVETAGASGENVFPNRIGSSDPGRLMKSSIKNKISKRSGALGASPAVADDASRLTFEFAPIGIVHLGLEGGLLRANKYFCDLTGYTEEEMRSRPRFSLVHPDDKEIAKSALERALRGDPPERAEELRLIRKTGEPTFVALSVAYAGAADKTAGRLIAMIEDIDARKKAEEALRKSEERFSLAMRGADEGLFDWNIAEGSTYLSPRWKSMLGYEDVDLESSPSAWEPMLAPGTQQILEEQIALLEAGVKATYEVELKLRHRDGRWLDILSRAFPVFDENHKMVRLVGTHLDITERKRHEAELIRAAKVFESTHEGIAVTDPQGRIVMVNPAFERITGYTPFETFGHSLGMLRSGRHDADFYKTMWSHLIENDLWQGEIWNRKKDGTLFPEWLTISAVRGKDGEIVNYIGLFTDISQLKQSQARLDFLAHHDPLTTLPNRIVLVERITQSIEAARRDGRQRALLFLDLDRFKTVNDSLGHAAGDEMLIMATDRWIRRLGATDMLARLGGDEFVVLVDPADSPLDTTRLANDLIEDTAQPFIFADGREAFVGLSVGISIFPSDDAGPDVLIQRADSALYAAKQNGGGGIRFYSPSQTLAAKAKLDLEAGLRRALERGEFELQYQPQFRIGQPQAIGVEALVRWRSPGGVVAPNDFIPLAERTGLIIPIGEWVLAEACQRMKFWLDAGYPLETMAVNLSPRQFDLPDIRDRIRAALGDAGLTARHLEIEITEGALMEQGRNAVRKLESLKELGVRIAVDDFGTGHSSLAYLKRFPIDTLKLDRSFIIDIPADPKSMEIAAAVIRLGQSLHVDVLAEGVETEAQLDFLAVAGCKSAQGYLLAKPMWESDWLTFQRGMSQREAQRAVG
jgi:diguanylate cyclase (GGDEF)-like protein/PAS domain S-box-containing protein